MILNQIFGKIAPPRVTTDVQEIHLPHEEEIVQVKFEMLLKQVESSDIILVDQEASHLHFVRDSRMSCNVLDTL